MALELILDSRKLAVYEAGAFLVTTLAFSEPRDSDATRASVFHSLCAWAIRTRAEEDGDWASTAQPIKPVYAAVPDSEIDRCVTRLNTRMSHRMIAARMALAFLKPASEGKIPALPPALKKKLSINRAAEWALGGRIGGEVANIKARAWGPSRPVLHLAAAVAVLRESLARARITLDYRHLLWEPEIAGFIVREAEAYVPLFEALKVKRQLAIEPGKLIRIRFSGSMPS